MSDVKRWEPENTFLGYNMRPDAEGSFVLHDAYAKLEAEAQALREQVAALRARVVVTPERLGTTTSQGLMDVMTLHHHLGWNACLDELARLNGNAVSVGELAELRRDAARYRWLRSENGMQGQPFISIFTGHAFTRWTGEHADSHVDKALLGAGKEHG